MLLFINEFHVDCCVDSDSEHQAAVSVLMIIPMLLVKHLVSVQRRHFVPALTYLMFVRFVWSLCYLSIDSICVANVGVLCVLFAYFYLCEQRKT